MTAQINNILEYFRSYAWGPLVKFSFSAQRELGAHILWQASLIWCLETCQSVFHDTRYFWSVRGRFFSSAKPKFHLDFPLFSYCFPIVNFAGWGGILGIFTKNLVTFASGGVRRSSWALECVEFHGESISGTPGAFPRDLGAPILKKLIFSIFSDLREITGCNNPGYHCSPFPLPPCPPLNPPC